MFTCSLRVSPLCMRMFYVWRRSANTACRQRRSRSVLYAHGRARRRKVSSLVVVVVVVVVAGVEDVLVEGVAVMWWLLMLMDVELVPFGTASAFLVVDGREELIKGWSVSSSARRTLMGKTPLGKVGWGCGVRAKCGVLIVNLTQAKMPTLLIPEMQVSITTY